MGDFAKRLAKAMFFTGIKQSELATKTGLHKGLISHYVHGDNEPTGDSLVRLANALGVTPGWLLGKEEMSIAKLAMPKEFSVPIIGKVAGGDPIEAVEDVIGEILVDQDPADLFALRIKGDSMSPRIVDGDVVLVRKTDAAEDGDLVIALVEGDATCKILRRFCGGIKLVPMNQAFEPLVYAGHEADNLRIIGVVIESRHKWKN